MSYLDDLKKKYLNSGSSGTANRSVVEQIRSKATTKDAQKADNKVDNQLAAESRTMSPLKYIRRKYSTGVASGIGGAEDFVRSNIATELSDSAGRIGGTQIADSGKTFTDAAGNTVSLDDYALSDAATKGGTAYGYKGSIERRIAEKKAEKNGTTAQKVLDAAAKQTLDANWTDKITNYSDKRQVLAEEAQKQNGVSRFTGNVAEVVGNMIPSMAVGTVNPQAGLAVMAAGAGGAKARDMYDNEGVNNYKTLNKEAWATALKEYATEKLAGGIGVFGKGSLDDIIEKAANGSAVKKYLLNAIGEGAEEVIADLGQVAIDRGIYNPDAKTSAAELGYSFLMGGIVSMLLNGGVLMQDADGTVRFTDNGEQLTEDNADRAVEAAQSEGFTADDIRQTANDLRGEAEAAKGNDNSNDNINYDALDEDELFDLWFEENYRGDVYDDLTEDEQIDVGIEYEETVDNWLEVKKAEQRQQQAQPQTAQQQTAQPQTYTERIAARQTTNQPLQDRNPTITAEVNTDEQQAAQNGGNSPNNGYDWRGAISRIRDTNNLENWNDLAQREAGKNTESQTRQSKVYTNSYTNYEVFDSAAIANDALQESDPNYAARTNAESMNEAYQRLQNPQQAYAEIKAKGDADGTQFTDVDVDTAFGLMSNARKNGDYDKLREIALMTAKKGTAAGQEIQAFAKYNRTPEGIICHAAKALANAGVDAATIDNVVKQLADFSNEYYDIVFNETATDADKKASLLKLIERQAEARNNRFSKLTRKALSRENTGLQWLDDLAIKQMQAFYTDFLPTAIGKKVSTWQTINLLLNTRTTNANILSNTGFSALEKAQANTTAKAADALLSLITKRRTVKGEKINFANNWDAFVKAFAAVNLDVNFEDKGRYDVGSNRTFHRSGNTNKVEQVLSVFEAAMGQTLYSTDQLSKGGKTAAVRESLQQAVDEGLLSEQAAQNEAKLQAEYVTFQNDSYISHLLTNLRNSLNGYTVNADGSKSPRKFGLGDFVTKFTVVGGNLVHRTIEYSPLGYIKAIGSLADMVEANQKLSGKKAMDATKGETADTMRDQSFLAQRQAAFWLSRATTGTGMIVASMALAIKGVLFNADKEEDADRKEALKNAGVSGTVLNTSALWRLIEGGNTEWQKGDKLIKLNWFAPISSTLNIGVALADKEKASLANIATASLDGIFDAASDLSVMQTLKNWMYIIQYGDNEEIGKLEQMGIELARQSLSSFVASPIRHLAQGLDPVERDLYSDTDRTAAEKLTDTAKSLFPGTRETLPQKITPMGNVQTSKNGKLLDMLNASVLPGKISKYSPTAAEQELHDLYSSTDDSAVYMDKKVGDTISSNGNKIDLTAKEKTKFKTTRGKTYTQIVNDLMENSEYKQLTDSKKVELLAAAKDYSGAVAKDELLSGKKQEYDYNGTAAAAKSFLDSGLSSGRSVINAYKMQQWDKAGEFESDKDENGKSIDNSASVKKLKKIASLGLTDEQNAAAVAYYCSGKAVQRLASGIKEYNAGHSDSISLDEAADTFYYLSRNFGKKKCKSYLYANYSRDIAAMYYNALYGE